MTYLTLKPIWNSLVSLIYAKKDILNAGIWNQDPQGKNNVVIRIDLSIKKWYEEKRPRKQGPKHIKFYLIWLFKHILIGIVQHENSTLTRNRLYKS